MRTVLLEPGDRIDLEQTIEERRDGELVHTRRARIELAIGRRAPDGTYDARAVLILMAGDTQAGRMLFDLRLAHDLTVRGDPIVACDELDEDLASARILRHVLAALPRPSQSLASGSAFDGELWNEHREEPLRAEARLEVREPGRVRITSESHLALADDRLAGGFVTGRARVRVIAELDESLLVGTTRTRTETAGTIRNPDDDGSSEPVPARVRIDERILAVRAHLVMQTYGMCGTAPPASEGAFDPRLVVRMIQTRQAAIRGCYEREMRSAPALAGSFRVSLTILESGMLSNVHTTERTTGMDAVAECTVGVIRRFRFMPGPEGGSATFQFPFVFEPQD